ncbi:MAG: hypothetical protein H0T79_04665 [Deltaproteobacteria bacterium]|nr:hypothetical protein [Deltaproteobacteria bacterium]
MNKPAVRRPAPPPLPARRRSWIRIVVIGALVAVLGGVVAVLIITRVERGEWSVPKVDDLSRIVQAAPRIPRTIYLERHAIEIHPGDNDSAHNVSSVLRNVRTKAAATAAAAKTAPTKPPLLPTRPAKLPGWKGTDKAWAQVVSCVAKLYEPFDVTVTDRAPPEDQDRVLVAVGGKPGDLGVADRRVGGLAPFNGGLIERPVVFAFSAALGNGVRQVCETIGMEVAHAYGLDHAYLCSDVMTYLTPCGAKRFVDKSVRCGEGKPRVCEGGVPTQNSYQRLMQVLGPRPRPASPS